MAKKLVIVESPTKAKTIARYLGSGFDVQSSYGHVRDLPKSKLGIDVEHDFAPQYVVPPASQKHVASLKKKAHAASAVYFATDEDREGEAIAWHLAQLLGEDPDKYKRITFAEITESAIKEAVEHPREIYRHLVDAQQARRVLDRLVGYELSPLLWKKVARGLSAGRVQSVAVRLIIEREREISAFRAQEYWTLDADLKNTKTETLTAHLHSIDGKAFDKLELNTESSVKKIEAAAQAAVWSVASVTKKDQRRTPPPPFTTSTLQQVANRTLGFSSRQTMVLAQQLYEGIELGSEGATGLITYMRTDSFNLADKFLSEAKAYITQAHGSDYAEAEPRRYKTKAKGAQEAHEAIRPSSAARTPESVKAHLDERQYKLYSLIWRRAVATQMAEAKVAATSIDIVPAATAYVFRSTGSTIAFPGWLVLYPNMVKENVLPSVSEGEKLELVALKPEQHFTEPPARYSEAGLIKKLEEFGIGRPSTYAPTIATIVARGYVEKVDKRLKPTDIAALVTDVLVKHFPNIVDYEFTAKMEGDLDKIASGDEQWVPVIKNFYLPFKETILAKDKELSKKELTEEKSDYICDKCGRPMVIKTGRFGKFVACTGYPECKNTMNINADGTTTEKAAAEPIGVHPDTQVPIYVKTGRFGTYVQLGEKKKGSKPKTASLLPGLQPETLTLEQAVSLLALPRTVGKTDAGEEIVAANGRFGPYIKAGTDTRSLGEGMSPLTVTLEQAKDLLSKPKSASRRTAAKKKLKELGNDPDGHAISILSGRYGPYVTDGKINASLPRGLSPEALTLEAALELIQKKKDKDAV